MARLHEYQAKALLRENGLAVPEGQAVTSATEARDVAERLGGPVVLKVQAWITGRAAKGGVKFADSPDQAKEQAANLLRMKFGNFPVREVLVEEAIDIQDELFVSIAIDDEARAPVLLLDTSGGSGIEDRSATVQRIPIDSRSGVDANSLLQPLAASRIQPNFHDDLVSAICTIADIARKSEARSLEVNPLVTTTDGRVIVADCRMTIDDYAVFRHPELGIEIARELDHPATELDRIAYEIEQADHRGTFYFAQLPTDDVAISRGMIGFHGAGGGGSMMSMDAITNAGFTLANFCDTSGNPSAAKVYRAARVILSQPNLVGYFGSGSGVASQEQFQSAYGLAKAFCELNLSIPAVIRLGGNSEDRAVDILHDACKNLPGEIEGFKKDDTPAFIAQRFTELVDDAGGNTWSPQPRRVPDYVAKSYSFAISGGTVWIDHDHCDPQTTAQVIEHSSGLLKDANGKPVPAVSSDEIENKDSELIALETECRRAGRPVVFVDLPIAGIDT